MFGNLRILVNLSSNPVWVGEEMYHDLAELINVGQDIARWEKLFLGAMIISKNWLDDHKFSG